MTALHWGHYPLVERQPHACAWMTIQNHLGLAENTINVYGRALQDYFTFCQQRQVDVLAARRDHVALYVHDLHQRPTRSATGLSNATIQQRLTVLRLSYAYLHEEGLCDDHPVGRGGARKHGLVPRQYPLPWLPTDEQWLHLLDVVRLELLRNRMMFALGYDAGLRREELCALETGDIDPAKRLLYIRAETTKNRLDRVTPYSAATSGLYISYLAHRRQLSQVRIQQYYRHLMAMAYLLTGLEDVCCGHRLTLDLLACDVFGQQALDDAQARILQALCQLGFRPSWSECHLPTILSYMLLLNRHPHLSNDRFDD